MPATNPKDVLTTGEVARICHVAPRTVSKWFDTGKLRGYRIPGSRDRRIPLENLLAFMRAYGIPMDGLDGGVCRVLIVDPALPAEAANVLNASRQYDVRTAANGFDAGVIAQQFRPHVIVLAADGHEEAEVICRNVKTHGAFEGAKVIAVTDDASGSSRALLMEKGFDQCLPRPYGPADLAEVLQDVTDLID